MAKILISGSVCLIAVLCAPVLQAADKILPPDNTFRIAVDPRVELLSILFHLAGNPEYNEAKVTSYAADVDKYFASFRNHRAVTRARSLHQRYGIGSDMCMMLAVHLDADTFQLRLPLQPWPEGLDSRWPAQELPAFLAAVRQFAVESKFTDFLRSHRALYETTVSRLREMVRAEAHLEWFAKFYGERRSTDFQVIPAMLDGPRSYGPHYRSPDGMVELYCILGVWHTDSQGNPEFPSDVLGVVVHEFCHSYANPLIDRHFKELQPAAEKLFRDVAADMDAQSYGYWKSMLYETLVRASVVRYLERYEYQSVVWDVLRREKASGFIWVHGLSDLLVDYEKQRDKYPTLDSFFPRIVKFFSDLADQAAAKDAALAKYRPRILTMDPPNGATNVNPTLTEIRVTFDRLMNISSWAMVGGGPHFPEFKGRGHYDLARTTWSIPVKLKPDWTYEFLLNSAVYQKFQALDGTPLVPVLVQFRTTKEARPVK